MYLTKIQSPSIKYFIHILFLDLILIITKFSKNCHVSPKQHSVNDLSHISTIYLSKSCKYSIDMMLIIDFNQIVR